MRVSALTRGALVIAAAGTAVAGVAACSSNDNSSSSSTSPTSTSSSSASPTGSQSSSANTICNPQALQAAIPQDGKIIRFACGSTGNVEIAAIEVQQGKTVFWAKLEKGTWVSANELQNQICGAASAGYSAEILSFCGPTPKEPQ